MSGAFYCGECQRKIQLEGGALPAACSFCDADLRAFKGRPADVELVEAPFEKAWAKRRNVCDDRAEAKRVLRGHLEEMLENVRDPGEDMSDVCLENLTDMIQQNARDDGMREYFFGTVLADMSYEQLDDILSEVLNEADLGSDGIVWRGR